MSTFALAFAMTGIGYALYLITRMLFWIDSKLKPQL